MTKNPITISSDATVGHTLDIFDRSQIKSIPVVNKDEIVGLITRNDIYTKSTNRQEKISDIMSINPLTVSPDDELVKAIEIIKKTDLLEIVVARYNKIVGVLSINDILEKVQTKK